MKNAFLVLAFGLVAIPALAQTPPAAPAAPPAPIVRDLAAGLKLQWATIRRNVAASADKLTEADYGFRPQGAAPEVMSFGGLLVHLADANNSYCARTKGEAAKPALDPRSSKADIVKALNEALAYCDGVYEAQTMASLTEMVKSAGRGGVTNEVARGLTLIANVAHNNEHYGNLVTYMRAKGVVPPSSEGR